MSRRRHRYRRLSALGLLLVPAAGAGVQAGAPAGQIAPPVAAADALGADQVVGDPVSWQVLYSWTTAAQIAELRQGAPLYSRSESPTQGPSYYDGVVTRLAQGGDPLAQLLRGQAFLRARFAWTNPWATLLGWPGESYGDQLLRIRLRPEAWLGILGARGREIRVIDGRGRPVAQAAVLREPRRLAGVYFLHDHARVNATMGTMGAGPGAPYREFVLCNEAMVASFEAGTEPIQAELRRAIAALSALRDELAAAPPRLQPYAQWAGQQPLRWQARDPRARALGIYERGLALPSAHYYPEQTRLAQLLAALRRAQQAQPPALVR